MEFTCVICTKKLMFVIFLYVLCSCRVFEAISSFDSVVKKCEFPAIFSFGASNSDTGGYSAALVRIGPPSGMTYFHKSSGRPSDGRLILDFIAQSFNLPLIHHYLDSLGANYSNGADFGVYGATIGPSDNPLNPFYLSIQYGQFEQFKDRSQMFKKQGGVFADLMPKEEYFKKALYTFDIGQNDLTKAFNVNPQNLMKAKDIVPDIVSRFVTHIKNLYGLGARSFWIHSTGPLGCLPNILAQSPPVPKDASGCAIPQNDVAQYFNAKLKEAVGRLRHQFPSAAFRYVDIFDAKYLLFKEPTKYGFDADPLDSCLKIGVACKNPSVKVIWDGTHYTEAANKFVFDRISSGKFSEPPLPLNLACKAG